MLRRGISEEAVETMRGPLETYLDPPINPEQTVRDVVEVLRPAFPRDVLIHGLLMHAGSGRTRLVADGARGYNTLPIETLQRLHSEHRRSHAGKKGHKKRESATHVTNSFY